MRKQILGPTDEKMGPTKNKAVAAVHESNATVALAAIVESTCPDPPRPLRALYIYARRLTYAFVRVKIRALLAPGKQKQMTLIKMICVHGCR